MSGVPKSSERHRAEVILRDYRENCRNVETYRRNVLGSSAPRPEFSIFSIGHDRDNTFKLADELINAPDDIKYMMREIKAVQHAFGMCAVPKYGKRLRRYIVLVYMDGTHTPTGAALKVGWRNPVHAGRMASRFLQWVIDSLKYGVQ